MASLRLNTACAMNRARSSRAETRPCVTIVRLNCSESIGATFWSAQATHDCNNCTGGRWVKTIRHADLDNINDMNVSHGTVSADVEYINHEDGTWSFRLTFEDDPVPIESMDNFSTKELAEEQVKYELQAASLRNAEG